MTARPASALTDAHLGRPVTVTGVLTGVTTSLRWVELTVRVGAEDVVEIGGKP